MKLNEFVRMVEADDFAVGDCLWIGDWQFEVVCRRRARGSLERWRIWTLSEEDIDTVVTRLRMRRRTHKKLELSSDEKHASARLFQKGADAALSEWEAMLAHAVEEVVANRGKTSRHSKT